MKIIIIITSFLLFCSCKFDEVKIYKEDNNIPNDTSNIEQIKIKTHWYNTNDSLNNIFSYSSGVSI